MSKLTREQQVAIIRSLIEGCSIRSTVRIMGVAKSTIQELTREFGEACLEFQRAAQKAEFKLTHCRFSHGVDPCRLGG